jgi:biotin transport system substrate-specific component
MNRSEVLLATRPRTELVLCGMMAALIALFSWISLPLVFSPVPLTLQTLAVLLAGGLLGWAWGPASVGIFLLLGLVGAPVFHNGASGPGVLAGPTGGFLLAFVPAALVMGLGSRLALGRPRLQSVTILAGSALVASGLIYLIGVPWMAAVTDMGAWKAVTVGLLPYLPGDLLKAAAAVALLRGVREAVGR